MKTEKKILTASGLFTVSMYFLYGHPRNFKFKPKYQQYGPRLFLDYISVSYDYAEKLQTYVTNHSFEVLRLGSFERLNKECNETCWCLQDVCSEKTQKQSFADVLQNRCT